MWSPDSWKQKVQAQALNYPDEAALAEVVTRLGSLPPLVTAWEIEKLRALIAEAQTGRRFILQGGDCAESFAECRPEIITNKLKILLQMSLVLIHATKRPVTRIGRFAGQYAKPRSQATETKDGVTLSSYFGDMFNRPEFNETARRADPSLLLEAYTRSALTLNYIRALSAGGFADLHHPEYWDLSFCERADISDEQRAQYQRTSRDISEALSFMSAITQAPLDDLSRVEFYTSHEALHLAYESAQTRTAAPLHTHTYALSTHMPWIGERTRGLDGAHIAWARGIRNPLGVKISSKMTATELEALLAVLNPENAPGRLVLITRMGAAHAAAALPRLIERVRSKQLQVLWMTDPMHGNTKTAKSGHKTRDFSDILSEIEQTVAAHHQGGSVLGGVHFELTGEDVTECIGGGIGEADLDKHYETLCDPRLNYQQALEMAFRIAALSR